MATGSFGLSRFTGRGAKPAAPGAAHPRQATALLTDYEASGLGWFWATDRDG